MSRCGDPLIMIILAATTLVSCGGRAERSSPDLRLQVQPVPGVYVQYESRSGTFRIGNELIERRISADAEARRIFTTAFVNKLSGRNYIRSLNEEFSFRANNTKLSGVTGDFEYINHETFGTGGVKGLEVTLRVEREEIGSLKVRLIYEIYSHMPVIRKWIEIENPGGSTVTVDSIQVESLNLLPGSEYDLKIHKGSGTPTQKAYPLTVFDTHFVEGFFIGNETPGVLKYSDIYSDSASRGMGDFPHFISIGMKPHSQEYATEIKLAPKEEFISPAVFILFFKGEPDQAEEMLAKFVAEYIVWSKTPDPGQRPVPQYSPWYENITADMTEQEVRKKVQMAAQSGADIFCLSGGWTGKRGDWGINEDAHVEKFGQYAHDLGMKFGLSMDLAIAELDSQIITEYPQWAVKLEDGSDCTIRGGNGGKLMCLGSEYTVYITYEIDELVKELNLDYIKLTGQMIPDGETTGCFAQNHVHRSSAESLWYIYEGLFAICEHLHSRHPELIIDVSPRTYSPEGTIDYALLKYADVEWPF